MLKLEDELVLQAVHLLKQTCSSKTWCDWAQQPCRSSQSVETECVGAVGEVTCVRSPMRYMSICCSLLLCSIASQGGWVVARMDRGQYIDSGSMSIRPPDLRGSRSHKKLKPRASCFDIAHLLAQQPTDVLLNLTGSSNPYYKAVAIFKMSFGGQTPTIIVLKEGGIARGTS